jgi:hypothetical protein
LDRFISFTIPNQEKSGVANQFFDLKNKALTAVINYTFLNKNMPLYHKLGTFPKKDTTIRKTEWRFYYEQLFGTEGFSWSCLSITCVHRPTQVKKFSNHILLNLKAIGKKHQIVVAKGLN